MRESLKAKLEAALGKSDHEGDGMMSWKPSTLRRKEEEEMKKANLDDTRPATDMESLTRNAAATLEADPGAWFHLDSALVRLALASGSVLPSLLLTRMSFYQKEGWVYIPPPRTPYVATREGEGGETQACLVIPEGEVHESEKPSVAEVDARNG